MTTAAIARLLAGLAAIGVAASVSSCSATKEQAQQHGSDHAGSSAPASQAAPHNADDVQFAQLMIPHHQQAVELSALVPDRSTDPAVIKLAATISAQQQPEVDTMKALLVQWDVDPTNHDSGHAGMAMSGMVSPDTMIQLEGLTGSQFDKLWLQSMVSHHRGAIEMAKVEVAAGKNPDMVTLARNIISAQQAEIDQMTQMLAGMGG